MPSDRLPPDAERNDRGGDTCPAAEMTEVVASRGGGCGSYDSGSGSGWSVGVTSEGQPLDRTARVHSRPRRLQIWSNALRTTTKRREARILFTAELRSLQGTGNVEGRGCTFWVRCLCALSLPARCANPASNSYITC